MKKQTLIAQGAEAQIFLSVPSATANKEHSGANIDGIKKLQMAHEKFIIKNRIKKSYRHPQLDEQLRKSRTKKEAKLLEKAGQITTIPKLLKQDKFRLEIEYIKGEKLSETLNTYSEQKQLQLMQQLGEQVAKLHQANIIHGDLTTSNILLKDNKIFIIDFGLGFVSARIEDKAVDLHLIRQALEAKHYQNWEKLFKSFLQGYQYKKSKKVLEQLKKVEARGRYKG